MKWIIITLVILLCFSYYEGKKQERRRLHEKERRERKAAELYELSYPIFVKAYDQLTQDIRDTYPLIPFTFMGKLDLTEKLRLVVSQHDKIDRIIYETLIPVVETATSDFTKSDHNNIIQLRIISRSSCTNSLESEKKFRNTEDGRNPPDWNSRRAVVFERDNGRCQRCGIGLLIGECHIHHLKRRSEGGDHSISNLVTLCRDCHALMDEHEGMKGIRAFFVSSSGIFHTHRCYHASSGMKIWGSVPRLMAKGYMPCQKCNPQAIHDAALSRWEPAMARFARQRFSAIISSLCQCNPETPSC